MYSHPLKVWDAEEDLHHCAEVTSVAQVFDARVTRTKHSLQLHARLLDHLPFTDPRPGVIVCVVTILCLKRWRELGVKLRKLQMLVFVCFVHRQDNVLFSASVACLFQTVTSVLICEGPTQLPPPQMSRHLKPKDQLVTVIGPIFKLT